ncbi:MAG: hypothetical protein Q4G33_03830 [bacterium]|nr:hypothetical protein [bacterium]
MKFLIIAAAILIFESGRFYGENKVHIRKQAKRARRNAILRMKWRIAYEMCRWKHYHGDKPLPLAARNGRVTYKHDGHVWNEREFREALRKEAKGGDNT